MTRSVSFIAALLLACTCGLHGAQKTATDEDGRKVILHKDGTWEYAAGSRAQTPDSDGGDAPQSGARTPKNSPASAQGIPQQHIAQKQRERETASVLKVVRNDGEHDFRTTSWGMTKSQVRSAETQATFVQDEGSRLRYRHSLSGLTCSIVYEFSNGSLVKGWYEIEQTHLDPALFYHDFLELAEDMEQTFGPAQVRDYNWKNDTFKGKKEKYGFAISIGFLSCHYVWQQDDTKIDLKISGKSHTFTTRIMYSHIG